MDMNIITEKNRAGKYNIRVGADIFVFNADSSEGAVSAYEKSLLPIQEDVESIRLDNLRHSKNIENRQSLADTDWKVIRELERKYLLDTDLSKEREVLRQEVIDG